jgi:hypothetical protein
MKKIMMVCLTVFLACVMSVVALAGPGQFIASPSGINAPILVGFENVDHACTARLIVTGYADRHTLDTADREKLEKAYSDIVGAADITDISAELDAYVASLKIDSSTMAVSELFDIRYVACDQHGDHGSFTITLKPETLKNFIGLMHLNGNTWELVENAKVEGENLVFTVDELSPFAIVVNTADASPDTGDMAYVGFYIALMAISAIAFLFVAVQLKKKEATN